MAITRLTPLGVSGRRVIMAPAPGVYNETVSLAAAADVSPSWPDTFADLTLLERTIFVEIAPAPGKWENLVSDDAPSGWWRFGKPDTQGDMPDVTTNGNTAIANGFPANFVNPSKIATHCLENDNRSSTLNAVGHWYNRYEGAFKLDGNNDYWNVPDDAAVDVGTGDFSVEVVAWWNPIAQGSGWTYLVSKGGIGGAGYYLRYNYTTDDLEFGVHDGTNSATATWAASSVRDRSRHTFGNGDAQHIVCTCDASTLALWVNGVARATADASSVTGSLDTALDLRFGADATGNYFADTLDEVAIYKGAAALTDADIARHYASVRWLPIEPDLIREKGFRIRHGKAGGGPTDLVASPGLAVMTVDNSSQNTAGQAGYYSPGHPNALADFGDGIRLRIGVSTTVITQWVFSGSIKTIEPSPDPREPFVTITAGDFFYDALEERMTRTPAFEGQVSSDIVEQLVLSMTSRPLQLRTYPSTDAFPIVFDDLEEEESSYLRALQSLAQSDYSHAYTISADSFEGEGTLVVWEPRAERLLDRATDAVGYIETDVIDAMMVTRDKANVINHVDVTYRRRATGSSGVLVASLRDSTLGAEPETAVPIPAGDTYLFHLPYTNPLDRQQRIGAVSVATPAATTDYQFWDSPEGSGVDLTSSLVVVSAEIGATSIALELRNDAATLGYLTKFDVRGTPVIADEETTVEQVDTVSVKLNGDRPLTPPFEMFYQPNGLLPSGLASYIRLLWANQFTDVKSVRLPYLATISTAGTPYFWHPGVRLVITDQRASINQIFFIQGVDIDLVTEAQGWVTFTLMPAHSVDLDQWVLEDATKSILETSTYASYF